MTPRLRNMLAATGAAVIAGLGFVFYSPQPRDRTMADLRDAGIGAGQTIVVVRPERLTARTRKRINAAQPGVLRPAQRYATLARVAVCFQADGGTLNCLNAGAGAVRDGLVVVPSHRFTASPEFEDDDGGTVDESGEEESDTSRPLRVESAQLIRCADFDAGNPSPFQTPFCSRLNRLMVVPPACVVPDCWRQDGGWNDDHPPIDCRMRQFDNSVRWIGCNVMAGADAVGAACMPVECSHEAGDVPDWMQR